MSARKKVGVSNAFEMAMTETTNDCSWGMETYLNQLVEENQLVQTSRAFNETGKKNDHSSATSKQGFG